MISIRFRCDKCNCEPALSNLSIFTYCNECEHDLIPKEKIKKAIDDGVNRIKKIKSLKQKAGYSDALWFISTSLNLKE